ncbi:hypothetical protein GCM10009663_06930 [Kitasatospora arboriphila]|uniref:Uncharacterized protein n=1 Tax=Kitasatospora arboriphila TaxID=258052 RepID=A0ABN1TA49_9ACTN
MRTVCVACDKNVRAPARHHPHAERTNPAPAEPPGAGGSYGAGGDGIRRRSVTKPSGGFVDWWSERVMGSRGHTEACRGSRCESGAVPPLSPGSTLDLHGHGGPPQGRWKARARAGPGSQETLAAGSSIQGADPE